MAAEQGPLQQRLEETFQRHFGMSPNFLDAVRSYPPHNLTGKVAVVTGSSDGVGRGIAERLAIHGADVVLHGRENSKLDPLAETLQSMRVRVETVNGNIQDPETAAKFAKVIAEKFDGHADILVNNAGSTRDLEMDKMTLEDWNLVIDTHLTGSFLTTKALWTPLKESPRARVIMVGSISGTHGNEGQANYSTAKAGLIGFTKDLAAELLDTDGTANLLAFGPIPTSIWDRSKKFLTIQATRESRRKGETLAEDFDVFAPVKAKMLGNDFVSVAQAASKALFLASSEGDGITGEVIIVSGGLTVFRMKNVFSGANPA